MIIFMYEWASRSFINLPFLSSPFVLFCCRRHFGISFSLLKSLLILLIYFSNYFYDCFLISLLFAFIHLLYSFLSSLLSRFILASFRWSFCSNIYRRLVFLLHFFVNLMYVVLSYISILQCFVIFSLFRFGFWHKNLHYLYIGISNTTYLF